MTTETQTTELVEQAPFKAPVSKEDFPQGETKIEHTYDNGNKVVFLLLSNGSIAVVREGTGADVEAAEFEAGTDKNSYKAALMSKMLKIDGKGVNMFELKNLKAKDYLNIQVAFVDLNF